MSGPALTRRAALAFAMAATAAPAAAQPAPGRADPWEGVAAAGERLVKARAAPGAQLCVRKGGRVLFSRGFGLANIEHGAPMTPTSVCRVASVTKEFTAALTLILAEEGRLRLDDRLERHLPGFPQADRITLRQLLNHTSGLWNYTDTADVRGLLNRARRDYTDDELLALMRSPRTVLTSEPGTKGAYSNTGYVLLALALQHAGGAPYGDLLRARITGPLGLTRTAPDDRSEIVPGRVQGYLADPAAPSGFRNNSYVAGSWSKGAGNLRSTADELCLWHEALFGGKVLKPASLEAMLQPGRLADGSEAKPLYGFGMMVAEAQGRRYYHHDGATAGFAADVMTFPAAGATMAYIFNGDWGEGRPDPESVGLINAFRGAALRAALA